jgi:hypothetical protein
MKRFDRIMPSPAMAVALTALFIALGGTGYATVAISARNGASAAKKKPSQASRELALVKAYLKSHSVPKALLANAAANATNATSAAHAASATTSGSAASALHAASADSATTAGSATSALHAASADSATTAAGAPPTGAAGGVLSGSYPNPGLAALPAIQPITTFVHGWGNAGVPDSPAGYYKDPFGIVHLTGAISGGTLGQVAFVLPPGYIVLGSFSAASTGGAAESKGPCVLALENSVGEAVVDTGCDNVLVSLEGITYRPTF